jgi:CheY-like chemotaxis protein
MPRRNGYEVLEDLRNDPSTATIPFIFITAQAIPAEVTLEQQGAADYYITKPFTPNELLQAIAKFI